MPNDEAQRARALLARADKIIAAVDESYIIKERGHNPRPMPTFSHTEIELGRTLGAGGFGIVNEITAFDLLHEPEIADEDDDNDKVTEEGATETKDDNKADDDSNTKKKDEDKEANNTTPKKVLAVSGAELYDDDSHYDIEEAREMMDKRCLRRGVTRFALKRLHDDLSEVEKARAMIDLAVEAKYLSVVWHPNIVKMRGVAAGDYLHQDFFIIMDRLFGTLDQRVNAWRKVLQQNSGKCCGFGKNNDVFTQVLKERMIVAYDLAVAFMYLHENRLVYRDIKPENIGFDVRGDVKVFDFGLCKDLDPRLKAKEGSGYRLTGRAGSLPYMAPEVAQCKPYDTKCDVYSFSILLWELLALQPAFTSCSPDVFLDRVVIKNQRPVINEKWPPLTRIMIPEAWAKDPKARPDMKRVAIMLRGDLNDMTTDENVRRRTQHMDDRSMHSMDGGG